MKSSDAQLAARGFAAQHAEDDYAAHSDEEIISLLTEGTPVERTIAARCMAHRENRSYITFLCDTLVKEKKLYTKLEICDALASFGEEAVPHLIPLLGAIGRNHHTKPEAIDLGKKSFPLPRDIAARILIRIGASALPSLESVLAKGTHIRKAEAVDAIGHIAFTSRNLRSEEALWTLLHVSKNDTLLQWKIIRAFQSFDSDRVKRFLEDTAQHHPDPVFGAEAERSLSRIRKRG